MKFSGIYKIICLANSKIYIGSSKDVMRRKQEHFWHLRNNNHKNDHLQNAWNKYGAENFIFDVILQCPEEELLIQEQKLLDEFWHQKILFNIESIALQTGCMQTPESLKKRSEKMKGRKLSIETKQKMSVAAKQRRPLSETDKAKLCWKFGRNYEKRLAVLQARNKSNKYSAKLTKEQVVEIRTKYSSGISSKFLANEYAVSQKCIQQIINRSRWADVP